MTLASANGDQLTLGYDNGRITMAPGRVLVFRSEMPVTGGTGRFDGASGWAAQVGTATGLPSDVLNGAPIEMELTGGIRYAPARGEPGGEAP